MKPWVTKVRQIQQDPAVKKLRIYFNNHYGAKAVENALEFREKLGEELSSEHMAVKKGIRQVLASLKTQKKIGDWPGRSNSVNL